MERRRHTVSQVAAAAKVSVRTLHYYDEIGLLRPSHRSGAGYRLYTPDDLHRLRCILLLRGFGFPLEAARELLDAPAAGLRAALVAQREALERKVAEGAAALRAIDATLSSMTGENDMSIERLFDGADAFDHARHETEARERWGGTDAWAEAQRRTPRYGDADWARIRAEDETLMAGFVELMRCDAPPAGEDAAVLAERHRLHIERWFYPCPPAMHAALADMYLADSRFTAHFERHAAGLAAYVAAAIRANAAA